MIEITMINNNIYKIDGLTMEEALDKIKFENENGFIKDNNGRVLVVRNIESLVEKK